MEFFEKYRLQNVGTTRARLAELISIFESQRQNMTIRELEDLRAEMDELTDRIGAIEGVERTTSSIILSAKFER